MKPRLTILVMLALALASCAKSHPTNPAGVTDDRPAATSAVNAVRLWAWSWNHSDTTAFAALLCDDFVFGFSPSDSADNPWVATGWSRGDEMRVTRNVFMGGGNVVPIEGVSVTTYDALFAQYDQDLDPRWHRVVSTLADLDLLIGDPAGDYNIPARGYESFHLVRGDSAAIDGKPAGATPDSTHWYLQRWQEQAVLVGAAGMGAGRPPWGTWGHYLIRWWN